MSFFYQQFRDWSSAVCKRAKMGGSGFGFQIQDGPLSVLFYPIYFSGCIPIVFVGVDVWRAFKKSKHWIPSDSVVLGALALQLLTLLTRPFGNNFQYLAVSDAWMFNLAERVSACVFIGCLLPGVACPRNDKLWTDMAAFIMGSSFAIFYISYDIYMLAIAYQKSKLERQRELVYSGTSINIEEDYCRMSSHTLFFIVFWSSMIIVSLLILVLLLVCAALASLSINNIVFYKIPSIISTPPVCSWKNVKEQVLKSWIVATTSNPQYIITRSILTSSIAVVITICNGILMFGTMRCAPIRAFTPYSIATSITIPFILSWVFILIGSAVIYCRCITAVVYYPRDIKWEWQSISQYFEIEDFWKKHLLRLKDDEQRQTGQSYLQKLVIILCIKMRLNKLLVAVLWLQMFLVVFSKGCWLLSQKCFSNRCFRKLVMGSACEEFYYLYGRGASPHIQPSNYETYLKGLIIMQGESPAGLWIANRKSFEKIKKYMESGEQKGKRSQELVNLLKNKSSPGFKGQKCLEPLNGILLGLEVESELEICKSSIKMTTVSILTIIIELSSIVYGGNHPTSHGMVDGVIQACSQAWNIFDSVENSERRKALVTKAADQMLKTLQKERKWLDYDLPISNFRGRSMETAKTALKTLAEKGKEIAKGFKSRHWNEVVAGYSLYSLCLSMNYDFNSAEAMLDEMVRMLGDVTGACIAKAWSVIAEDCKKWAADYEEERIWNASHVAGIVNGLTESVGDMLKPRTHDYKDRCGSTSREHQGIPTLRKSASFQAW